MITLRDFWEQKFATTGQYFFTRVISQRIGAILAWLGFRLGLSPNAVTVLGLATMLAGSACLACAPAGYAYVWASLLLYQLGFGFDCADGQLARATKRSSRFGGWLDIAADHVRQVGILLAIGIVFVRDGHLPTAACALGLLVLGSGQAVSLHTVAMLKAEAFQPHRLTGASDRIRRLVKEISDTPLFLLVIALLAPWPGFLLAYVFAAGLLYLMQATALAVLRIDQTSTP
ncbi:MAG TPA: CDP-alcohol phosphatidyltransferase family protein [Solimonas sp.]|nr:CDP-alcohol phosphatidyltransferase family protein [Solimonas sp.]